MKKKNDTANKERKELRSLDIPWWIGGAAPDRSREARDRRAAER